MAKNLKPPCQSDQYLITLRQPISTLDLFHEFKELTKMYGQDHLPENYQSFVREICDNYNGLEQIMIGFFVEHPDVSQAGACETQVPPRFFEESYHPVCLDIDCNWTYWFCNCADDNYDFKPDGWSNLSHPEKHSKVWDIWQEAESDAMQFYHDDPLTINNKHRYRNCYRKPYICHYYIHHKKPHLFKAHV